MDQLFQPLIIELAYVQSWSACCQRTTFNLYGLDDARPVQIVIRMIQRIQTTFGSDVLKAHMMLQVQYDEQLSKDLDIVTKIVDEQVFLLEHWLRELERYRYHARIIIVQKIVYLFRLQREVIASLLAAQRYNRELIYSQHVSILLGNHVVYLVLKNVEPITA